MLFEQGGQGSAHVARTAQLARQQKRAKPQRLPGQGQVPFIVDLGPLEAGTEYFNLRVIEKHFGPPGMGPARRVGLGNDPLDKLADQLPKGLDGTVGLFAQPFAQLGLIGKALDAGQLARQRFVIEPFGIGQTRPAAAETIEQLGHQQFGSVTMAGAHAGINPRQGADFLPRSKR